MKVKCLHDLFINDLVFYKLHEYDIHSEKGDFITILDEYNNKFNILKTVKCTITYNYYFDKVI